MAFSFAGKKILVTGTDAQHKNDDDNVDGNQLNRIHCYSVVLMLCVRCWSRDR